jgi:Fe2+ or Zn2+ uptake regulation protein
LQSGQRKLQSGGKSIYFNNSHDQWQPRADTRHEDTEYVECLECGDVFDSEEFRDMEIEDTAETEDAKDDM